MIDDGYAGGWFGESWGAPVCDDGPHRATPVGQSCTDCGIAIAEGDQGLIIPHVYERGKMRLTATHISCFRAGLGQAR